MNCARKKGSSAAVWFGPKLPYARPPTGQYVVLQEEREAHARARRRRRVLMGWA
jgi:hypothetical protein